MPIPLMGHSTILMTERYAHLAPSSLADAIEVLSPSTRVTDAIVGRKNGDGLVTENPPTEQIRGVLRVPEATCENVDS